MKILRSCEITLTILDLALSDGQGVPLMRDVYKARKQASTIVLTGDSSVETASEGYRYGVKRYLQKPVPLATLNRRVVEVLKEHLEQSLGHMMMRSFSQLPLSLQDDEELESIDLVLQDFMVKDGFLRRKSEDIQLTEKEAKLLTYFLERQGNVISQEEIMKDVIGGKWAGEDACKSIVRSRVRFLRSKLEIKGSSHQYIKTVTKRGYIFMLPENMKS